MRFQYLSKLIFRVPYYCRANLVDEAFISCAKAWPSLRHLAFTGYSKVSPSDTLPSLAALSALVHHCPKLSHLELEVDASRLPSPSEYHPPPTTNTLIETLNLRHSRVPTDPVRVAVFLLSLFPRLTKITTCSIVNDVPVAVAGDKKGWRRVQEALAAFRRYREWSDDLSQKFRRLRLDGMEYGQVTE